MDNRVFVLIVITVLAIIVAAVIISRKRKSEQLKEHFGPEYQRAVQQHGGLAQAEAVLADREKRVSSFKIHVLSPTERETFSEQWTGVQRRFVDDPAGSVTDADRLVTQVMGARGYPMADFEQRAADVSVSYPNVVQNYRSAREIIARHAKGQSSTEDLRQAMVHYRSLFEELLESNNPANTKGVFHERAS